MKISDLATVAAVCMVVLPALTLGVGPAIGASSGSNAADGALTEWNGKTTEYTASHFDRSGFSTSEGVVTHGSGLPGWYVTYDTDENDSYANLEAWIDASDDRRELTHDADDGLVLVAAPGEHVYQAGTFGDVDGLAGKSYVESIEIEQRVELVEPVSPKTSDQVEQDNEPGKTAKALAKMNGGDFGTSPDGKPGVAYDDDVNRTDMGDVKQAIDADSTSLPASADGSRVTAAYLDTGATVGTAGTTRGVVWGNGTAGSTPRITHGKNFVANTTINRTSGNYSAIEDGNGHGSYVAARSAGAAGGSERLRGPLYRSDVAIGKVLSDSGSGSIENIRRGLEWACGDVNADVVGMSLGSASYSAVLENEIESCVVDENVSAVVVAAGNERWTTGRNNIGSPADAQQAITVVATTTDENASDAEIAYFGNVGPDDGVKDGSSAHTRGTLPDVGSPGMKNTVYTIDQDGSTKNVTLSGTSMSAPDGVSAAGLVVDEDPSLRGDHEAVRERLLETASPARHIGYTEIGHGRINVSNAITDTRPVDEQRDVRTSSARARDQANEALAGRVGRWLKSQGYDL